MKEKGYDEALAALQRACRGLLDRRHAGRLSLARSRLQSVSEETGGFYERSFHFPDRAVQRLAGALAGHYVLLVEAPERPCGWAELAVKLTRRSGTVLARTATQ
jgi:hypothetical protein